MTSTENMSINRCLRVQAIEVNEDYHPGGDRIIYPNGSPFLAEEVPVALRTLYRNRFLRNHPVTSTTSSFQSVHLEELLLQLIVFALVDEHWAEIFHRVE